MIRIENCQLCGHDRFHPWYAVNEWTLVRCAHCGFIFLNPRPALDYFKGLYDPLSQYDYKVEGVEYIRKEADFISAYHKQLEVIESVARKGALLEIGSACGFFLEAAQQRGWKTYGVELSTGGAGYCKKRFGIDVFNGDVADAGFPANFFDLIVTIHTLEHVYDPAAMVRECGRIVRPGGILVVEIPYVPDDGDPSIVKAADIPSHMSLFTKRTLNALLEQNGFSVIKTDSNETDCILRMTAEKQDPSAVRRSFAGMKKKLGRVRQWLSLSIGTVKTRLQTIFEGRGGGRGR